MVDGSVDCFGYHREGRQAIEAAILAEQGQWVESVIHRHTSTYTSTYVYAYARALLWTRVAAAAAASLGSRHVLVFA